MRSTRLDKEGKEEKKKIVDCVDVRPIALLRVSYVHTVLL